MKKTLSEMSLEELWQLFPIILTEHKSFWHDWYREEQSNLVTILPMQQVIRISHIGSTAIDTIWAKPIIDILVEILDEYPLDKIRTALETNGYICMSEGNNRLSFNKGYTADGFAERVFHLHARHQGDHDELYFRDYMMEHPDTAKEYENLKLGLWKKYEHNRDAYTENKTNFVKEYTLKAKEAYGRKYE